MATKPTKKASALTPTGHKGLELILGYILPIVILIVILYFNLWATHRVQNSWDSYTSFVNSTHGVDFFKTIGTTLLKVFWYLVALIATVIVYSYVLSPIIGKKPSGVLWLITTLVFSMSIVYLFTL